MQSLNIFRNTAQDPKVVCNFAETSNDLGECMMGKREYKTALTYLQNAHKIQQATTTCSEKDTKLAKTLHNLGLCLVELQEQEKALIYLKQSLAIYERLILNENVVKKIALIRYTITRCNT